MTLDKPFFAVEALVDCEQRFVASHQATRSQIVNSDWQARESLDHN
jgi:hypothetical protein